MVHLKYLIIGGGMTADSAVQGIRKVDPAGTIGIISAEKDNPYNRPPLSKGLWKGKPLDSIWRKTEGPGIKLLKGYTVEKIDPVNRQVVDNANRRFAYERLLLATGGSPRKLPFGGDDIIYFRTLEDYRKLRALSEKAERFAVIGGGFIGSEIAAALAMNKKEVTMIFPEAGIGDRVFPRSLSEFLNNYYREKGVRVLAGDSITGFEKKGDSFALRTTQGQEIFVEGVVAGLGIEPNIGLATQSGINVGNGIPVDEYLCTSQPDIFAAGDVAEFYNPALDRSIRVEHEDNANMMGLAAGLNMAGKFEPYHHLPYFYSDLFELGYEAVGMLDSRLEIRAEWITPNLKGEIHYLENNRIRGVLLWNLWDKIEDARKLISQGKI